MPGLWAGVLAVVHGGITLSTHEMYVETHFGSLLCIAMLNTNLVMLLLGLQTHFIKTQDLDIQQLQ